MLLSVAIVSQPLLMLLIFHMFEQSSKKFFVYVLSYRLRYLMLPPKMTGTRACSFRRELYAYPISGTAIVTAPYLVKMQTNSGQSGILTNTESCRVVP